MTMGELEALPEEQVVLEWNETSMMLIVKADGGKVSQLLDWAAGVRTDSNAHDHARSTPV